MTDKPSSHLSILTPFTVDYVYQVGFHQINIICYVTLFVY
jgi:hypothetical protein